MIYFSYVPTDKKFIHKRILFKSDSSIVELLEFYEKTEKIKPSQGSIICSFQLREYSKYGIVVQNGCNLTEGFIQSIETHFDNVKYINEKEWEKLAKKTLYIVDKEAPSNELEIREAAKQYLQNKYEIHFIQDEYTHTALNVRSDIFAVSKDKKVVNVEIKSNKDTFARLENQLDNYINISHVVYVALDVSHLSKFLLKFNQYRYDCIGVLFYENGKLHEYRKPIVMETINVQELLWKNEYVKFIDFWHQSKAKKIAAHNIIKIIHKVYTIHEYQYLSEILFLDRYLNESVLDLKIYIEDIEYKKKKIEKHYQQ
jgi:hypothetical protein